VTETVGKCDAEDFNVLDTKAHIENQKKTYKTSISPPHVVTMR